MAVETNARIEFSVASVEEWEKVNPKLHQGEPVFAKKPSGKYILKVGAPGGSTYKNAVVVWDQDDAETKMTSTQEAAAQALASKNVASASASAAKASENAAAASKSAAATSEANAKTSETNAAASANTAKAWSMSDGSPDGVTGNKSAKTWAEEAKTSASASASNASASAFSATNSANSAKAAMQSETASANSASAAASSASSASTSATNAKTSETNAAKSATAAAQSAENAKLFDPTSYAKLTEVFPITDTGRKDIKHTITDLNDIKCISYPSWSCLDSAYVQTVSNCPTKTAFYLFNVRNGASSSSKGGTFTNLTSYYYYIAQLLLDIGGNMWVRTCFNRSNVKFNFSLWVKVATKYDLPTQYVQSVTESNGKVTVTKGDGESTTFNAGLNILARNKAYAVGDIAYSPNLPSYLYLECTTAGTTGATEPDMSSLSGGVIVDDGTAQFSVKTVCAKEYVDSKSTDEAKKWKNAYNTLQKRSYPTEFDDDELTLLMDTQLATGTITLSQPYTDFDGLYIEYTDNALNAFNTKYISTAELNYRIARSIALKGGESGATISLISGEQYWRIWCGKSRGFTTTTFPVWTENCIITRIYGVKFKEIT
jgi:hypothetical protein